MDLHADNFHAIFSGNRNNWQVTLDDITFRVHYIRIDKGLAADIKTPSRLGATVAEIHGTDVDLTWTNDVLRLCRGQLACVKHRHELYNPDMPRNLAKSVTVK